MKSGTLDGAPCFPHLVGGKNFQGVYKNIILWFDVHFNTTEIGDKWTFKKAHCRSPGEDVASQFLGFPWIWPPLSRIPRQGRALDTASNNALYL